MLVLTPAEQREALIPKIAKVLTSFQNRSTSCTGSTEQAWFEQKLRISMTRALDTPRKQKKTTVTRSARVCNDLRDKPSKVNNNAVAHAGTREAILKARHDETCSRDTVQLQQTNLRAPESFTDSIQDENHQSGAIASREAAAESAPRCYASRHRSSHQNPTTTTVSESDTMLTDVGHYEMLHAAPYHVHDILNGQENDTALIDTSHACSRRAQLTHDVRSTFWHGQHQHEELLEDILIYPESHSLDLLVEPNTAREQFLIDIEYPRDNAKTTLIPQSRLSTISFDTMDSQDSRQSLSELLGDDSHLWTMFKRRASACPPEVEAAELSAMFQNDPDMKIFSPIREDDFSYRDAMMFDTYDFSRQTSRSSGTSSPASFSQRDFEQLAPTDLSSYSSSLSRPTNASSSTRASKEDRRRSSGTKKSSRAVRSLEDDIVYQQTSTTRSIDIKPRKSTHGYSNK